jgi:hypothetical protein
VTDPELDHARVVLLMALAASSKSRIVGALRRMVRAREREEA